jgi:hypothetical protein
VLSKQFGGKKHDHSHADCIENWYKDVKPDVWLITCQPPILEHTQNCDGGKAEYQ